MAGETEKSTAATKAAERAAQKLTEAQTKLSAINNQLEKQLQTGAMKMGQLASASDATKQAVIDLWEAQKRHAVVTQENIGSIGALTAKIAELKEGMGGVIDVADAVTNTVKGMWGVTAGWSDNITASLAAGMASGQGISDVFDKISSKAQTTAGKQQFWGSMALKATEAASAGFAGILHQTISLANATDQQTVAFKNATGASQQYVSAIPALESRFFDLGLSMEDAAGVMGSLYSSMSGFTRMGPAAQKSVRETTAVLVTLGISAEDSARNMEIMNRSLGMSGQQAAGQTRELFALSQQLNISTTKMMSDFQQLGPQLVVHGSRAVTVFKRLQMAAKESGIELNRMMDISAKFDRFDTAAESVGHLNAVLGGPYLSVMKMVQSTDPTERMRMLSAATRQAGLSFDTLGYYERKAIADAAGLQNVNELALVMRSRFDLVGDSTKKSAYELEKLAEQNKEYKSIQDELAQAMRALAVPATQVLIKFKDLLNTLQRSPGAINAVMYTVVGLKGALMGVQLAASLATAGMVAFKSATMVMGFGLLGAVVGVGALATALATKQHSPPLVGEKSSILGLAAQQAYGVAGGFRAIGAASRDSSGHIGEMAAELNSMPDSKMIHIEKVFNAETDVLEASKGAAITAHTVRLLGAAQAGSAGGSVIQNHMDVTVEMDGRVVGSVVKRQLSDRGPGR